jgi:hypothetical protein
MKNSSITEKSSQIPENQLRFLNQDQQPATKLISALKLESTEGLPPAQIFLNPNPV